MALSRCKVHENPQGRNGNEYVTNVEPINFPDTSSICGRNNCNNPGLIWLTKEEKKNYDDDKMRIFNFPNSATKVKVK